MSVRLRLSSVWRVAAFKGGATARVRADPERGGDGTIKRNRLQEDCCTSGRLITKTSAGRVCGVAGSKWSGSRIGRAPALEANRYTIYIAETRVHLLFVTLSHATVTMMDGHTHPNIGGKTNKPGYLQKSLPPTA